MTCGSIVPSVNTLNPKESRHTVWGSSVVIFFCIPLKLHPPGGLPSVYFYRYNKHERCPGIAGTTPGRCQPQSQTIKAGTIIIQCPARKRKEKMNMKKIFALLLAVIMVLSLAACGGGAEKGSTLVYGSGDYDSINPIMNRMTSLGIFRFGMCGCKHCFSVCIYRFQNGWDCKGTAGSLTSGFPIGVKAPCWHTILWNKV